jgi:SNF family Na+-dependent transporter
MKKKDDVVLSGLAASSTNELFEVGFGGMITLTASVVFLGLAGTTAAVSTGSFGLGFTTLPVVFAHMGPFGNFIGAAWFFMLFLAAITSSLSMYQPSVALIKEALGWAHGKATAAIVVMAIIGTFMTLWFTKDGAFLSTVDFWVGTLLIFVMATVQIIYFGWVFGIERGWKEMHEGASIRIPPVFKFIMKYVAPAYLLIVFIGFCYQNLVPSIKSSWANTGSRMGILVILATLVILMVITSIGAKRWKAEGIDLNDDRPLTAGDA